MQTGQRRGAENKFEKSKMRNKGQANAPCNYRSGKGAGRGSCLAGPSKGISRMQDSGFRIQYSVASRNELQIKLRPAGKGSGVAANHGSPCVHIKMFSNEFLGCLLAGFEVYQHTEKIIVVINF